jgi:ATP-dependent HslUV protease subunit HslV
MTVIAFRDGVMAADTATWMHDVVVSHRPKIVRLKDGRLYAATGARPEVDGCRLWLEGVESRPKEVAAGEFGAIVVDRGFVFKIDHRFHLYDVTDSPWVAEGAHCEFLAGCLAAGATAEEAVRLAIVHCAYAAGDVQVVEF